MALHVPMLMLLTFATSCSSEDFESTEETAQGEYYFSISVDVPSPNSTRSETNSTGGSSSGIKPGSTLESTLTTAQLFFFDASETQDKGKQICSWFAYKTLDIKGNNGNYTLTTKIELDELRMLGGKMVNLYVLGNIPEYKLGRGTTDEEKFLNGKIYASEIASIKPFDYDKEGGLCPLSNNNYFTIDLTDFDDNDLSDDEFRKKLAELFTGGDYPTDNPTGKLWKVESTDKKKTLELQRAVARIDYNVTNTNLFKLSNAELTYEGGKITDVYMKVYSLQLFNLSKEAHLFRHTSEGTGESGTRTGGKVSLFGIENSNGSYSQSTDNYNWIYDTDWSEKSAIGSVSEDGQFLNNSKYFLNQPVEDEGIWKLNSTDALTTMDDLKSGYSNLTNPGYAINGYAPWFYVMENTLPSTEQMNLAWSTGISFMMQLCDSKGDPLKITNPYVRITMTGGDKKGYYLDIPYADGGYFLNYRYLIEHNNKDATSKVDGATGKSNKTGPMHIGIVRNNIYGITLSAVKNLPDPNEPDYPDLFVEVKVLPWNNEKVVFEW